MEGNRSCRHPGLLILGIILICTLQDSVAIDAPDNVAVKNEGNTDSLNVTWTSPADATAHEVTWSPPDSFGNITSGDLSGTANEYMYIINDLTPGTLYNVTVTTKDVADETNDTFGQGRTKPSPVNLSEYGATNDSISAEWTQPIGAIDQYSFSCSNGTEDPSSPITNVSSNMYEVSCMGLSAAGANYTITVTSQSGDESSDESTITITALPNLVVLTASDSTVDSVNATWMKPAGDVTSYDVQCSSGTVVPPPVQTGDGPFSASCTGLLTPGDEYTMTVTSLSNGKSSDVTTIDLRALPEAVTLNEESGMVTTTIIAASWTIPNGIVEYYDVSCSDNGIASPAQVNPADDPSDDLTASCTGLSTPGDNYTISVTTVSNGKLSAASTITITALPLSANLTASTSTINSVSAMWPFPGGLVEVFEVDCMNGTESSATVLVNQTNLDQSYLVSCDGVWNPGDNYIMFVTSVSNDQDNSASIMLTALPLSVNLVANTSTTSSVSATWQFPGGVVEEFEVQCSDGNETTYLAQDMEYLASCTGLETPGDNYTMTVTSLSNTQTNLASIVLTACEYMYCTRYATVVNYHLLQSRLLAI